MTNAMSIRSSKTRARLSLIPHERTPRCRRRHARIGEPRRCRRGRRLLNEWRRPYPELLRGTQRGRRDVAVLEVVEAEGVGQRAAAAAAAAVAAQVVVDEPLGVVELGQDVLGQHGAGHLLLAVELAELQADRSVCK